MIVARAGARAYRTGVRALVLALAAASAAAGPPALAADAPPADRPASAVERRREAIARELLAVGAALQREIARGDAAAIVGPRPGGGPALRRPDGAEGARRAGPRGPGELAPRRLLRRAGVRAARRARRRRSRRSSAPAGTWRWWSRSAAIPRAGPTGRPCLELRAKELATPGAPLCFEERGGRWWLTESLYPCG